MVAGLPKDTFDFLSQVQKKLSKIIKSVGKIEHEFWRSFYNERKTDLAIGCVDGDLIESCLDLTRSQLQEVVAGLEVVFVIQFNNLYKKLTLKSKHRYSYMEGKTKIVTMKP